MDKKRKHKPEPQDEVLIRWPGTQKRQKVWYCHLRSQLDQGWELVDPSIEVSPPPKPEKDVEPKAKKEPRD